MSSLIELLSGSSTFFQMLAITLMTALTAMKIFLNYKRQVEKKAPESERFRAENTPQNLDNLSELLVQNFRILNSFYSESLSQYRTSSIASISIAVLGFVVIIAGLLIAFIGQQVAVGSVSAAAGVVGEAAALLFFKQNQAFQAQMEGSLKKLVSSQYLMTSIALARELDGEHKVSEVQQINHHLRLLMNGLHDVKRGA